jgi:hypothetical protein
MNLSATLAGGRAPPPRLPPKPCTPVSKMLRTSLPCISPPQAFSPPLPELSEVVEHLHKTLVLPDFPFAEEMQTYHEYVQKHAKYIEDQSVKFFKSELFRAERIRTCARSRDDPLAPAYQHYVKNFHQYEKSRRLRIKAAAEAGNFVCWSYFIRHSEFYSHCIEEESSNRKRRRCDVEEAALEQEKERKRRHSGTDWPAECCYVPQSQDHLINQQKGTKIYYNPSDGTRFTTPYANSPPPLVIPPAIAQPREVTQNPQPIRQPLIQAPQVHHSPASRLNTFKLQPVHLGSSLPYDQSVQFTSQPAVQEHAPTYPVHFGSPLPYDQSVQFMSQPAVQEHASHSPVHFGSLRPSDQNVQFMSQPAVQEHASHSQVHFGSLRPSDQNVQVTSKPAFQEHAPSYPGPFSFQYLKTLVMLRRKLTAHIEDRVLMRSVLENSMLLGSPDGELPSVGFVTHVPSFTEVSTMPLFNLTFLKRSRDLEKLFPEPFPHRGIETETAVPKWLLGSAVPYIL